MNARQRLDRLRNRGLDPDLLTIEPLAPYHDRAAFSCGEPSPDDYIKTKASQDLKRQLTRCNILVPQPGQSLILGYYTVASHTIDLQELDEASRKKLRAYAVLPALLVGRLAVDSSFKGAGLGWLLMMHAMRTCLEISFQAGSTGVVVDALHEQAAGFYSEMGFAPIGRDPLRLHMPMATVAALFPAHTAALRDKYGAPSQIAGVMRDESER